MLETHFIIDKRIVSVFGIKKALFIENLIAKLTYQIKHTSEGCKDNWFLQTHEQQTQEIGYSEYTIRQCKKFFKKLKILDTEQRGLPSKEYYHLNIDLLNKLLK